MRFPATSCLLLTCSLLQPSALAQQYSWQRGPAFMPAGSPTIAYDERRGRVLVFLQGQTWEFDGVLWTPSTVPQVSGNRVGPGVTYDAVNGVTWLFGGSLISGGGGYQNDLWTFDGRAWTSTTPALRPPPRWNSPIAYDTARQRLVLYGGEATTGFLNDTWEFDGTNWTRIRPVNTPVSHLRHSMVYDAARGVVVLFGGLDVTGQVSLGQTWEWDGVDWTLRRPARRPFSRNGCGMTYDHARQRVVLFGGRNGSVYYNDTWAYDGINWTRIHDGTGAPPADMQQLCYDSARDEVVCVVSRAGGAQTWAFDGSTWSQPVPVGNPSSRDSTAMAFDPVRGVSVMFGGTIAGSYYFDDTWEYRAGEWRMVATANLPPPRAATAMAFDPVGGSVLLFGGSPLTNDTWHYDGVDWQQHQPAVQPPVRFGHALATDSARGRVVLFGGGTGGAILNDTWEWDGQNWIPRTPATSPPPRAYSAIAHDPVTGRTHLYGGAGFRSNPVFADHWEWDGSTWTQVAAVGAPGPLIAARMAYDSDAGALVLYGGYDIFFASIPVPKNDVWEWTGTRWSLRPTTAGAPPAARSNAACYDATVRRLVVHVGDLRGETWELGQQSAAGVASYGAACAGSFGLPRLHARGRPLQGSRWFGFQVSSLVPGTPALLGVGVRAANVAVGGGCTLLVDRPELLLGVADGRGGLDVALPIPDVPAVRGLALHAQGVALDSRGAFANLLSFTSALRVDVDR